MFELKDVIDFNKPVSYIDIEADGCAIKPRVVQIAVVQTNGLNDEVKIFNEYSNPECILAPRIREMLQTDESKLEIYPNNKEVMERFREFVKGSQVIYFGGYDESILKHQLTKEIFDTMIMIDVQRSFFEKFTKNVHAPGIASLCYSIGRVHDTSIKHDALTDAYALKSIIDTYRTYDVNQTRTKLWNTLIKINRSGHLDPHITNNMIREYKFNLDFKLLFIDVKETHINKILISSQTVIKIYNQSKTILKTYKFSLKEEIEGYENYNSSKDYRTKIARIILKNMENTLLCCGDVPDYVKKYHRRVLKTIPITTYLSKGCLLTYLKQNIHTDQYIDNVFDNMKMIKSVIEYNYKYIWTHK